MHIKCIYSPIRACSVGVLAAIDRFRLGWSPICVARTGAGCRVPGAGCRVPADSSTLYSATLHSSTLYSATLRYIALLYSL